MNPYILIYAGYSDGQYGRERRGGRFLHVRARRRGRASPDVLKEASDEVQ